MLVLRLCFSIFALPQLTFSDASCRVLSHGLLGVGDRGDLCLEVHGAAPTPFPRRRGAAGYQTEKQLTCCQLPRNRHRCRVGDRRFVVGVGCRVGVALGTGDLWWALGVALGTGDLWWALGVVALAGDFGAQLREALGTGDLW